MTDRSPIIRFARAIERTAAKFQGKGYGTSTCRREVAAAAACIPSENLVVFDVGANTGHYSREWLAQGNRSLKELYAFEPSTHNHKALTTITDPRFHLVKKALGRENGAFTLYYDAPGSGLASLTKRNLSFKDGREMSIEERVDVITVDEFLNQNNIPLVDLMKIDVEGHEYDVLQGAHQSIHSGRINAVAFEFGGTDIDTRVFFQDFWFFFQKHRFDLFRINPFFPPIKITRYHVSLESFDISNYLAIRSKESFCCS
jgi:FkbM family methyltransferase